MSKTEAHDIAQQFVMKHKDTFRHAQKAEVKAAVEKITNVIRGVRTASEKAQRQTQRRGSSSVQM